LIAFACSRALAFYRPSIGWSKLGLAVGSRSVEVYFHTSLRRSEPLGARPSSHLHYDGPRSQQTRSRPSTASIEAPLHSASATQIGPLETTSQKKGLTFTSPMWAFARVISATTLATSGSRLSIENIGRTGVTSPTDATPTNRNGTKFQSVCALTLVGSSAGIRHRSCARRPLKGGLCAVFRRFTAVKHESDAGSLRTAHVAGVGVAIGPAGSAFAQS